MNDDERNEPQRRTDGLRPFKKNDARINRSGRPRSFFEFRKLAQQIAREKVIGADGNWITRAELLLRNWAKSRQPILQRAFIEFAFGKVPDKIETTGLENKTQLILHYAHEREAVERENHEREGLTLKPPADGLPKGP